FSSRRRHTRFKCDWSSDVCSSDLFSPTIRVLLPRVKSSFRPPKVLALARDLGSLPKVKGAATVKALGFQKGVVEGFKLDLLVSLTPEITLTRASPVK